MIVNINDITNSILSYDEFFTLLKIYCMNSNLEETIVDIKDSTNIFSNLENKKLIKIIDDEIVLRESGKRLIEELVDFNLNKREYIKNPFEEFWQTFPSTDKHGIFYKTRNLKSNKSGCKKKYEELLEEGIKHRNIIKALLFEIEERKKLSTTSNKLSFMKNSHTWLSQREFDIILETINEKTQEDDWTSNTI